MGRSRRDTPESRRRPARDAEAAHSRPRLRWLRLAAVLSGLLLLAGVSTMFGMMMAVAQDLPDLEVSEEFQGTENSILYDVHGQRLATLTGDERRIIVESNEISEIVKEAVISIEDQRFYEHEGIDMKGIGRALIEDVRRQSIVQGGSTITQQFVKNAVAAQQTRTVLEKLREAALAYNLERKWSKDKILTEYLNSIYFGEGAYGIESAARTYFGWNHEGCGEPGAASCASVLSPHEAAFLAGIIASPARYSPRVDRHVATIRRDLVLDNLAERGVISEAEAADGKREPVPALEDIASSSDDSEAPYFTSWMRQQVADLYGPVRAFGGGLHIRTTLDLELQQKAEEIVGEKLADRGPSAAVVVLDNRTGGVRAMVGGENFEQKPYNLATSGHRQPGSAFKPFILVRALEEGRDPLDTFTSEQKVFDVPEDKQEKFVVNNYEDQYMGVATLQDATTFSDNSVYAELGLDLGTRDVAQTARRMGIKTEVSTNPAMTLGGLRQGTTPLEMAHAYLTLARGGKLVSGTMAPAAGEPVAIMDVMGPDGEPAESLERRVSSNEPVTEQVVDADAAEEASNILETVVQQGTGKRASWGGYAAGKTGTTENNADAWFVGYTDRITVAVWVGYPESTKPMDDEYLGGLPVDGGTFPADIWRDVVLAYESLQEGRGLEREDSEDDADESVPAPPSPDSGPAPEEAPPEEDGDEQQRQSRPAGTREPEPEPEPQEQAPERSAPPPAPAPEPPEAGEAPAGAP